MKTFLEYIKQKAKVPYEAHDYYGSPKKLILARKSPSSSGGGGGNGE